MQDSQFMQKLFDFDKDNIKKKTITAVKYTVLPELDIDNVAQVSKAALSLCMWVHAMSL